MRAHTSRSDQYSIYIRPIKLQDSIAEFVLIVDTIRVSDRVTDRLALREAFAEADHNREVRGFI
jgi:hypothetical protein